MAVLQDKRPMLPLSDEDLNRFDNMQACPRCQEQFTAQNWKVKHHNHRTGKFIDALCNKCNLQSESTDKEFFIPVVFHNLKKMRTTFPAISAGVCQRKPTKMDTQLMAA